MSNARRSCIVVFGWLLIFVGVSSQVSAAGRTQNIWNEWNLVAKRTCPSHHLDLLGDVYDELIGDFSKTLTSSTNAKADAIADVSRRCSEATMGFQCEMGVYLDAYKRLKLLNQFVAFACHRYKCLEAAYCVNPKTNQFR